SKISVKVVTWLKPNTNLFKLNGDDCSKGNTGRAEGGGILRDHKGDMIMAYIEFYAQNSSNYPEAEAIFSGIK
ncbi:hypothetical protein HAX54_008133, partial [Datura stramonium]|nr:hypothetical protein [Datura stramonium]